MKINGPTAGERKIYSRNVNIKYASENIFLLEFFLTSNTVIQGAVACNYIQISFDQVIPDFYLYLAGGFLIIFGVNEFPFSFCVKSEGEI